MIGFKSRREYGMDIAAIIEQLQDERARIDAAIEALSGQVTNHRVKRATAGIAGPIKRRAISQAERKRRSDAQKARWAERKKKKEAKSGD